VATILVVDDEPNNRLLVRTIAEHLGHAVVESANGEDALAVALSQPLHAVVLDLSLPTLSGPEFLRKLRAIDATRAVPVILYTATEPSAALRDLMEIYGVELLVSKPAEPQKLLAALTSATASS
jgi:CheY-like chemotaxis protein